MWTETTTPGSPANSFINYCLHLPLPLSPLPLFSPLPLSLTLSPSPFHALSRSLFILCCQANDAMRETKPLQHPQRQVCSFSMSTAVDELISIMADVCMRVVVLNFPEGSMTNDCVVSAGP